MSVSIGGWLCLCGGILLQVAAVHTPATTLSNTPLGLDDACGRKVEVAVPINNMLLFTPTISDYLFTTRAPETVISGNDANRRIIQESLFQRVFPKKLDSWRIFNNLHPGLANIETIFVLKPDVILDWDFRARYFESFHLPAACVNMRQGSEGDVFADVRFYARLLGQDGRSEFLVNRFAAQMADVFVKAAGSPGTPTSRIMFVAVNSAGDVYGDVLPVQTSIAASLGVTDVQANLARPNRLNLEQILRLDPETIILQPHGIADEGPSPAQIMESPAWQPIQAIRSRRVYAKPHGLSGNFTGIVETPLYARWLAEILHPSMPRRLRAAILESYNRELAFEPSADDIDTLLMMGRNASSAGYERFSQSNEEHVQ